MTSTEATVRVRPAAGRDFTLVLVGHTLALVGSSVYQVALMWWVLAVTGSTTAMATASTFSLVPALVMGPLAGVYVDRLDRRRLLVASTLVQGSLMLVPAVLLASGRLEVWHTYLVAAALALAATFSSPAVGASLPNLVAGDGLVRANSLLQLAVGLSGVLGPALGGMSVASLGEAGTMGLNAAIFLTAGACISQARWTSPLAGAGQGAPVLGQLAAGLIFIARHLVLLSVAAVTALLNFAAAPLGLLLPVMAREVLGGGPAAYGTLGAALSLGATAGAATMAVRGAVRRKGRVILFAVAASGLGLAGFGMSRALPAAVANLVAMGCCIGVANVLFATALQTLIPDDRRGRVMAAFSTFNQGLRPLAIMLVGVLADRYPAPHILALSGVLIVLVCGSAFLVPGMRDIS